MKSHRTCPDFNCETVENHAELDDVKFTLPKTNIASKDQPSQKEPVIFQPSIFQVRKKCEFQGGVVKFISQNGWDTLPSWKKQKQQLWFFCCFLYRFHVGIFKGMIWENLGRRSGYHVEECASWRKISSLCLEFEIIHVNHKGLIPENVGYNAHYYPGTAALLVAATHPLLLLVLPQHVGLPTKTIGTYPPWN